MKMHLSLAIAVSFSLLAPLYCKDLQPPAGTESKTPDVPTLDELAGEWQDASTLRSSPAINSPLGAIGISSDAKWGSAGSFPPIAVSLESSLKINNAPLTFTRVRWFPYQVEREGMAKDLKVTSRFRMHYQQQAILHELTVTNTGSTPQTADIQLRCGAYSAKYEPWGWNPGRATQIPFQATVEDRLVTFRPGEMDPGAAAASKKWKMLADAKLKNAIAFAEPPDSLTVENVKLGGGWQSPKDMAFATWKSTLAPGASKTIRYVMAIGKGEDDAAPLAKSCAAAFDEIFGRIKSQWQETFNAMFAPDNRIFSGNLPVLETGDKAMRRVYYMSAVSLLSVMRTSLPHVPRGYVGNSPGYNAIGLYYWDARELAMALAMLDPAMLKKFVSDCIGLDIHKSNMQEFITGQAKGVWYSANDFSVFVLANEYLNVTRDTAFLQEEINGKKVIDHLEGLATYWKKLVRPGRTLADYGGAGNLLECVPTYIHEVPSFNAANVWMMRRVAAIRESLGDKAAAERLNADADNLLKAVLELYEPGKGVWDSLHRDGTRVEMRHVLDFATIGHTIPENLTPAMRKEMAVFVRDELITDHWMRAQSLSDPAADKSDRPDHGPMGAFSAWPAETLRVLCEFGEKPLALDFLHKVATATDEGPFSQSRELMGKEKNAMVRITSRGEQTYNAVCGVGFIDAIIGGFFNWHPDFLKKIPGKGSPSGAGWSGSLLNLPDGSARYDVTCDQSGGTIKPSTKGSPK